MTGDTGYSTRAAWALRAEQCDVAALGFCRCALGSAWLPAWLAAAHPADCPPAAGQTPTSSSTDLPSPTSARRSPSPSPFSPAQAAGGSRRAHLAGLCQGGDDAVVLGGIGALQRHLQLVILARSVHRELLQAGQGRRQRRSGSARGAALEQVPAGHPLLPPAASGGPGDDQTQAVWRRPPDASSSRSPAPPAAPGLGPGGQRCSSRSSSHPASLQETHHAVGGLAGDIEHLVELVLAALGAAIQQVCRAGNGISWWQRRHPRQQTVAQYTCWWQLSG